MQWKKDELRELERLSESGFTDNDIADILNRPYKAVVNARARNGIVKPEPQARRRIKQKDITEDIHRFCEQILITQKNYKNPFSEIKKRSHGKQEEDQVVVISDAHGGMINHAPITGELTYNHNIQMWELGNLNRGIRRFYDLYAPAKRFKTLYITILGDMVTNDRIFEGQKFEIVCGVGEQVTHASFCIRDFILCQRPFYEKIVVVYVVGNHGRTTEKPTAEPATNNFEYLLANLVKSYMEPYKDVEVIVPKDYQYELEIRGHKYLLMHGNYIKGCTLNSIEKACKEIAMLAEDKHYNAILIGHFHACYSFPILPSTTLLINGCFIHKDSFAWNALRKHSQAKQWLFNVSNKSYMHDAQQIDLRWENPDE